MECFGYVLAVAVAGYFLYWFKGKIDAKKGNKGTGNGVQLDEETEATDD